jgi:hypothetical protein
MEYERNVFINCPFDGQYAPLFRAILFAVSDCGFHPRSALEIDDGSEVRFSKLLRLIRESKFGIHDLSRTELDEPSALPRFNMPFELGLFVSAKYFGTGRQREKACIIFDRDRYRYQAFCSDLAGQDIRAHNGAEADVIRAVRDALRTWRPAASIHGGAEMYRRYREFLDDMPTLSRGLRVTADEATFQDLVGMIRAWLQRAEMKN